MRLLSVIFYALTSSFSSAQFPPSPHGVTVLQSKFHEGINISYKQNSICETTPGVRSFSGYVHLPLHALNESHADNEYPINIFFWFFEARKDPHDAPLAIWLSGGPGASSLMGTLVENGPCFVGNDSNSTYLNPRSWNNEVNMLYIDQPVQTGFSYDYLTNVTATLTRDGFAAMDFVPTDFEDNNIPEQNLTFRVGTSNSRNVRNTANTTHQAAVALWHFAQTWFEEFPAYKPHDEQISLWTESYGGRYGPAVLSFFMRQNERIANGTISSPGAHYLHINTLGLVNAGVDVEELASGYANFAVNNTYGIHALTDTEYHRAMYELGRQNGIIDQIRECRRLSNALEPNQSGAVDSVNRYCSEAADYLTRYTRKVYQAKGQHSYFDITHPAISPFPPSYLFGFLNQQWVQQELGVPLNYSFGSDVVAEAFTATGDFIIGSTVEDVAYILDHGVRVAMVYGDRDYACNWVQGEATSLKIPWEHHQNFKNAGYAPVVTSPVHSAGLVRQYGNLSFTRLYQAGHMSPYYQPEAVWKIFMRAMKGKDIATGEVDLRDVAASGEQYASQGPSDAWWMKSDVIPAPDHECYLLSLVSCTEEEKDWVFDGTALVEDYIVVGRRKEGRGQTAVYGEQEVLIE